MTRRDEISVQADRDIRIFSFKLDRRYKVEDDGREAEARATLDNFIDNDGGDLREAVIHWLTDPELKLVVKSDHILMAEIRETLTQFKSEFFISFLSFLRTHNIEALQEFSADPDGPDFDPDFVNAMMEQFDGNGE